MHIALLASTDWLDDELLSLQHLVVGLIDEQVRVTQVVPPEVPTEDISAFAERVLWGQSRWDVLNRRRRRQLAPTLRSLGVDLVHALDRSLWSGAAALGEALGAPVALGINAPDDVEPLIKLAPKLSAARTAVVATSDPIGRAVEQHVEPALKTETIPLGVHPGEPVRERGDDDALCAVVTGSGQPDAYYEALLQALVPFVQRYPQAQFFFDGQGTDQHALWQHASRLGLLANLSLVPRRLGHHELLVRADVLIQPPPQHRVRSLTLQAMANGVPVVSIDDPWVDHLIDGQTAWLVPQAHAHAWSEQVNRLMREPGAARALGQRAVEWIRRHRLASQQVAGNIQLYRAMTGETLPFPTEQAGA